jgi:hypothetical protein
MLCVLQGVLTLDRTSAACRALCVTAATMCSDIQVGVTKGKSELQSVDIPGFPIRRWYCRICNVRVLHDKLSADGTVIRKVSRLVAYM